MGCTCCRRISTRKWRNCICPHSVLTSRLSQKSKRTTLVWESKALSSLQHTVIRNCFFCACLFLYFSAHFSFFHFCVALGEVHVAMPHRRSRDGERHCSLDDFVYRLLS